MANYGSIFGGNAQLEFAPREFHVGKRKGRSKNVTFCDNSIKTSKYNALSFLPVSLLEQFRRVANLYFLFIAVLMIIGTYTTWFDSPLAPWSTLVVLTLVVSISVVKGGLEDMKRHTADRDTNSRIVQKLDVESKVPETFVDVEWKHVKVGDILKINNNQEIPADLLLLATSESFGSAYIETSNIDGETNLKVKYSAPTGEGGSAWSSAADLHGVDMTIQCEQPNSIIHQFNGTMMWNGREIFLDASSLLLRGSSLRNTKWALGVVVYTGRQTKIVMNSRGAPFKVSSIERTMNNIIYVILAVQILISGISLGFYITWKSANYNELEYLCFNYEASSNAVYANECSSDSDDGYPDGGYFFTFFILYSNLLPISMYVTVEICNYFQAYFIDSDVNMYDEVSNTPAIARTSNMNADLGMVEYIFSDKTGTLTDNVMRFRRCSIAGQVYGAAVLDDSNKHQKSAGAGVHSLPLDVIRESSGQLGTPLSEFVILMAVCHTCMIDSETGELQSESPDEEALVKAAEELGWTFIGRMPGKVVIQGKDGQRATYQLMATVPFDSTRKRMSVVVRRPDNSLVVYCKGADNIIFDRANSFVPIQAKASEVGGNTNLDVSPRAIMDRHLDAFGADGLRTLVLSSKELSASEYEAFRVAWAAAEKARIGKEDLMRTAAALIEKDLTVIGATAIEDKLQDGVPQAITELRNAGIKLWVLTGDKVETAINIGYSARLLGPHMVLIRLQNRGEDSNTLKKKLQSLVNHFKRISEDSGDMLRSMLNVQRTIEHIIFGVDSSGNNKSSTGRDGGEEDRARKRRSRRKKHLEAMAGGGEIASKSNDSVESAEDDQGEGEEDEFLLEGSPLIDRPPSSPALDQLTSEHLALIVDGETLLKIFGDEEMESLFLSLATICKSLLACRVSPEQKRLIVRLVKKRISPRPVTLSIGDGANDVAMIQEAQIGVGISGKEGRQAVNSSDFAIAQFRFLKRLMLIHGRLDYRRTCKVVLYSFYKNVCLTLCLFAYTFFSGYSGQSLFDDYIHSAYNLILAWPVIAFGAFDRDISIETLEKYHILYVSGRERMDLNISVILSEMAQACIDAVIIFLIPYFCYIEPADVWDTNGKTEGIWVFGTTVYTGLVMAMFARIAILTDTWTLPTHLCFWLSIVLFIVFLYTYQFYASVSYNFYGVTDEMVGSSTFWWLTAMVTCGSVMLDLTIRLTKREFMPSVVDIGMEIDSGASKFNDLLPQQHHLPGHDSGTESSSGEESEEDLLEEAQAGLKYSKVLDRRKQKFPLDWQTVQGLQSSLSPQEQERLGIQSTDSPSARTSQASTFNFDHIYSGPGAGLKYITSALSLPLIFVGIDSSTEPTPKSSAPNSEIGVEGGATISPFKNGSPSSSAKDT